MKTLQACEVLQKDLDRLHQREKRWQLRFHARKCNIMRATHAKKKQLLYEYKLGGEALLPTNSTAYLRVELSSDLEWNTYVRKTASKANQTLGVLRRNLKNCPRDKEYGLQVYPPAQYGIRSSNMGSIHEGQHSTLGSSSA